MILIKDTACLICTPHVWAACLNSVSATTTHLSSASVKLTELFLCQISLKLWTPLILPACSCRAVCSVFSTWLSEYPEDFKGLREPSRLLRLAPLLPQDSTSAADLRARLLRTAEELSEKALLPDSHGGLGFKLLSFYFKLTKFLFVFVLLNISPLIKSVI